MHRQPIKRVVSVIFLPIWAFAQQAPAQEAAQSIPLTLTQATELAVKNNLQTILAGERIVQARGQRGTVFSQLLPNISGAASQSNMTLNLAAEGFTPSVIPGIPAFLGPFSVFDARVRLTQSIFNLAAIRHYQAGKYGVDLAGEQQRFATQQVMTAAALSYVGLLASEEAVANANANLQLAQRLLDLATNQRNAGLATGLDVARAETRLANQQVQLAQAQTDRDTARLDLLRVVGLPLGTKLSLADPLKFTPADRVEGGPAVQSALAERSDLKVAEQQLKIATVQRKAAMAGWAPSLSFGGDYGTSAIKPNELSLPTRSVGVSLDVPIFNGGRTHSEVQTATSLERQAAAQAGDLKLAIEKDVRQALDNLKTRESQVRAAQTALSLATRELELSEDRFANGIADNIEVVTAQTALENARQTLVTSLAQFNVARLNLAAASGRVEDFRL
jgi:outer membrane protein TolC